MGVTYTTAADRTVRQAAGRVRLDAIDLALAGASIAALILLLTVAQPGARSTRVGALPEVPTVNLNTIPDARPLEPVLVAVFDDEADRRLAARSIFALVARDDDGRSLANVGAIARLRVPIGEVEREGGSTLRARLEEDRRRASAAGRAAPATVPLLGAGDLAALKPALVVREPGAYRRALLFWALAYVAAFQLVAIVWRVRGRRGDRVLLAAAHVLTAIGLVAMVSRPDPLRDSLLFVRYTQGVVVGLTIAAVVSALDVRRTRLREFSYVPLAGAVALSAALILFGSGPSGSNAKVNLGPVQPIETIRVLMALFLAGYFARRWELLRAMRTSAVQGVRLPAWINLPRARYVVPVVAGVGLALALFFLQKDLGPALMLCVVFLTAYGVARGTSGLMFAGLALLAAGFYLGYRLEISTTLAERVRMWQSPWDNAARGGDQIAQALWSLSTGGWLGTGAGLGDTRYLPAGHTDLVLAAIGEEFGFAGLVVVGLLYVALVWRSLSTARRASTDYAFFLAIVLTLFLAVPVILVMSGILGLVPLTGVVTPFLSYGGSAMTANFAVIGLLAAIRSDDGPPEDLQVFRRPLRWLSAALAAAAVVLVAGAGRVQALQADALVVKPHLGLQADGVRRFQYNPRVLDVVRAIPRGTILDRQGLALATDDRALVKANAQAFDRLGISLSAACPEPAGRCYPLGGRAFHVLGDARARTNWAASNTSFVERDREARLRGFDDHETSIQVPGRTDAATWTVRRDYRDLVPILRHRYDRGYPAVKAAMEDRRALRVTLDARLQVKAAAIVAEYARRSATRRAAAVVIDVETGDLLASVSYPWPEGAPGPAAAGDDPPDDLLDRARYGLYPPGSTFKLITAAAALQQANAGERFYCSRLPDGRVGARVPGYARPIRDDVLDREPHGALDLRRALVVSCNAYFAQLAVSVGPGPLGATAGGADIALARGNASARIRDTLPQIGYGQGEVVVTPLRLARVAAAIAAGGALRETRLESAAQVAPAHPWLTSATARGLAGYMRDVVLDGTGRSLRGSPVAIAGKTGTAELAGQPSHSWFVGFAPFGPATRRIAFAVIVENAGYGGAAAAPAAGEIVNAAAALGLVK